MSEEAPVGGRRRSERWGGWGVDLQVATTKLEAWGLEGEGENGDPKPERQGPMGGGSPGGTAGGGGGEGAGSQWDARLRGEAAEPGGRVQSGHGWQVEAQVGAWSLGTGCPRLGALQTRAGRAPRAGGNTKALFGARR